MKNFTVIRNGLLSHIRDWQLCPFDLGVYVFLLLRADWATGIYQGCALTIAHHFADPRIKHHVNKCLMRLRDRHYINYPKGRGRRGGYAVLIHKYEVTVGELTGMRLDAWKHGELVKPEYQYWNGDGRVEEEWRKSDGRVGEPILDLKTLLDVNKDLKTKAGTPKKSTSLPEKFQPSDKHKALAGELGVDLQAAFLAFRDHHISKGSIFQNWDAALNKWLRNENKFAKGRRDNGNQNRAERRQASNLTARETARAAVMAH